MESAPASDATVDIVFDWLNARLEYARTPLEVAVLMNQAPFVVAWATARRWAATTRRPKASTAESFAAASRRSPTVPSTAIAVRTAVRRALGQREFLPRWGALPDDVADADAPSNGHTDLLVVSLQPNSTRVLLPIVSRLRRRGVRARMLLDFADSLSKHLLVEAAVPHALTAPPVCLELLPTVGQAYLHLRRLWTREADLAELLRALHLEKESPADLAPVLREAMVRGLLRGAALEFALRGLPADSVLFVTNRALLDHLLRFTHPGARTFLFVQGAIPDIPPMWTPLGVDHALVGSSLEVPYLERCGIGPERTTITGYTESDDYERLRKPECRREFERLHPNAAGRPLVVFTSQYATPLFPDWARRLHLEMLVECARHLPNVFFVLKLHPIREAWDLPTDLANVLVLKHAHTAKLIKAADLLLTYWSTTALEALLLGTPLIQVNATNLPDFFDLSTRLGRPIVRTMDEMLVRVQRSLAGEETFDLDADRARIGIRVDGGAAERAATAIVTYSRA